MRSDAFTNVRLTTGKKIRVLKREVEGLKKSGLLLKENKEPVEVKEEKTPTQTKEEKDVGETKEDPAPRKANIGKKSVRGKA